MPVESVTELFNGTGSQQRADSSTANRLFHVLMTTRADGSWVAESAIPVQIGHALPGDPRNRRCVSISSDRVADHDRLHLVKADYEYKSSTGEFVENPLQRPPDINWEGIEGTEPMYLDGDNLVVANSAECAFDPPVEDNYADPVLVIEENIALNAFNAAQAVLYKFACNSDGFNVLGFNFLPMQARILEWTARYQRENGYKFWRQSRRIGFRPWDPDNGYYGWIKLVVDEGRTRKLESGEIPPPASESEVEAKTMPIRDRSGQQVSEPVKLDGGGYPLASSTTNVQEPFILRTVATVSTVFRKCKPRKMQPFNVLNLPSQLP